MSKYISEFTSIDNINYKVEIDTQKGTSTQNFILGGNPFITSMDSDGKTMFAPIKSTGATIEMLVKNTLPLDIYTNNNQGTKVILTNTTSNKVEWVGYITPSSYSQDFNNETETLQIDCVDGLASLKDVPYRTTNKDIETFINIIFKILKVCNCYKYLYITDNIRLTSTDTSDLLSKLRITEANFFEQKDYENQPDEDVAMTCYDVLYEVMQYMGYTILAKGEEVYILDYDALINNKNRYFRYSLSGSSIGSATVFNFSHSHNITSTSFAETGTDFSLSEVFNQCIVEDDFYDIDSMLDGVENSSNLTNITATTDTQLKNLFRTDNRYKESEVFTVRNKLGEDESFFITIVWDYDDYPKHKSHNLYFVLGKFYKNALISTIHYNNSNVKQPESNYDPMCYSKLLDSKGATYVGYFTKKIDEKVYNEWRAGITSNWDAQSKETKLAQFGKLCNLTNIGNKNLTNYIVCLNGTVNHITHENVKNYPFFTVKKDLPTVFGGEDGYIILHGTIIRHDMSKCPFPMNGDIWIHKDAKSTIYKGESYIWSRLKWGNYYWSATGDYSEVGNWTTTPSYFKIFYGDPTKDQGAVDFEDKSLKFYNNCGALWGVDEDGYYIPTPPDTNLTGNIEWTMYCNKDTKGKYARNNARDHKNSYEGNKPYVMLYKDLDITVGYSDDALNEDAAKSDTIYTNNVSSYSKVAPMDEIKFKICTFDNKTPSYSTVDYLVNGTSTYLDKTYNQSTGLSLRQEQHFIVKNVAQYQYPRILLELNLKNSLNIQSWSLLTYNMFNGKSFIIDTMNIDYKYNKVNMSIIEKTNNYN